MRIGNAAHGQLQLDVYGEVMDALHQARMGGLTSSPTTAGRCRSALIEHLEAIWDQPDEGIWEVRGGRRHFTHSKVMAWVAFDRAHPERRGVRPRRARSTAGGRCATTIHATSLRARASIAGAQQLRAELTASTELDASLLLIPLVGFLPADDPRMRRHRRGDRARAAAATASCCATTPATASDGLPPGEGAFLACSFWLADNYALQGRDDEARALFERLLALRNDVGLLAEEYDPAARRQVGNFPQAFSHIALVSTATTLARGSTSDPRRQ